MSELEDWLASQRKKVVDDPEEARNIILSQIDKDASLYRLELIYDQENHRIVIQGNNSGLNYLLKGISQLVRPDSPLGSEERYDYYSGLSKCDLDLVIKKVADSD